LCNSEQTDVEQRDIDEETERVVFPVESNIGVRKPPAIPSTATTIAFNRTARRNATAVINHQ